MTSWGKQDSVPYTTRHERTGRGKSELAYSAGIFNINININIYLIVFGVNPEVVCKPSCAQLIERDYGIPYPWL